MKHRFRTACIALFTSVLFLGAGCDSSSKDSSKAGDESSAEALSAPEYFKEIPADSLYVYASMKPLPKKFLEERLERVGKGVDGSWADSLKNLSDDEEMPKAVKALVEEIEGNLHPEGYKKLGLSMQPTFGFYGVGGLPVLRLKLGDADAFEKTLSRIDEKLENPPKEKKSNGKTYRLYKSEELRIPVVIRGDEVVTGVATERTLDVVLPSVLGEETPEESLADENDLAEILDEYDYEPWAVGRVDLDRAVRSVLGLEERGEKLEKVMAKLDEQLPEFSKDCQKEIDEMAAIAPRLVMGPKSYEVGEFTGQVGLELEEDVATSLNGVTEPVPAGETEMFQKALFSLGLGVNVEKLKKMAEKRLGGIADKPYKCQHFSSLNQMANKYKNIPVPPQASGLQGASVILDDISFDSGGMTPSSLSAVAVVRVADSKSLLETAKPMVPGLAQSDVKANGEPVELSQLKQMASFLEEPHLTVSKNAIAVSVGKGMTSKAAKLTKGSSAEGSKALMLMNYDAGGLMEALPKSVVKMLDSQSMSAWSEMNASGSARLEFTDKGIFMTGTQRYDQSESSKK